MISLGYDSFRNLVHDFRSQGLVCHTVKSLAVKTLVNKDCRKFGEKNFGELKSMCIIQYVFNPID